MNYKSLFPVLTALFLLNSCSKDNSEDTTPDAEVRQAFQATGQMTVEQTALYTKDGIQTNPAVIQGYLNRHFSDVTIKNRFTPNGKPMEVPGSTVFVEVMSNGMMRFNGEWVETTEIANGITWLTEIDFTEIPVINNSPCGVLFEKAPVFTPHKAQPDNTGSKYRKSYPVHISNDDAYIPVIYFAASGSYSELVNGVPVTTNCATVTQNYPEFNLINSDISAGMQDGDTLLIQTGKLPLAKRS